MTDEEQTLLVIRGAIAGLPPETQAKIANAADRMRAIIKEDDANGMAIALIGAEMAAQP